MLVRVEQSQRRRWWGRAVETQLICQSISWVCRLCRSSPYTYRDYGYCGTAAFDLCRTCLPHSVEVRQPYSRKDFWHCRTSFCRTPKIEVRQTQYFQGYLHLPKPRRVRQGPSLLTLPHFDFLLLLPNDTLSRFYSGSAQSIGTKYGRFSRLISPRETTFNTPILQSSLIRSLS
jgi:hypothetical protein